MMLLRCACLAKPILHLVLRIIAVLVLTMKARTLVVFFNPLESELLWLRAREETHVGVTVEGFGDAVRGRQGTLLAKFFDGRLPVERCTRSVRHECGCE